MTRLLQRWIGLTAGFSLATFLLSPEHFRDPGMIGLTAIIMLGVALVAGEIDAGRNHRRR